jgi:acetyltransferase-like isoleucine patch superfamily enzyme
MISAISQRAIGLLDINIPGSIVLWFNSKCVARLKLYRRASVKLRTGASVGGRGRLHVGIKWPAYLARKTGLSIWDHGTLDVAGEFLIYSGCQIVVDKDAKLDLGSGYINSNSTISCFGNIKIGHDVAIAENVTIRDSDNHSIVGGKSQTAPIIIGDHVWIGLNTIILKGVTIGDGSIIAAGSLVNKSIPPNCLAAGVPAKVIRENVAWT